MYALTLHDNRAVNQIKKEKRKEGGRRKEEVSWR